jgi:predicted glycogen debranching enzyme
MLTSNPVALEPITITGAACRDWVSSSELEGLETNGTGAFAMGTVAGANTRRYHGLLVASLRPPVDRRVLLSRVEEEILCDGELCNLGAAQYPGAITPAGFQQLEEFRLDPYPVWRYQTGCATLEKRLFLVAGQQTVVLLYQASARCRFRLRPFLAFRDYHSLQHATDAWRRPVKERAGTIVIEPFESMPALQMHHNAAGFVSVGNWYYNNEYREEMDRGLDFREDLYSPGWFDFELEAGQMAFLVATVEPGDAPSLAEVMAWEKAARAIHGLPIGAATR